MPFEVYIHCLQQETVYYKVIELTFVKMGKIASPPRKRGSRRLDELTLYMAIICVLNTRTTKRFV
ncbi:MAG TPA: hypothetical protein DEB39_11775 [Planctomycetaceae bacterium]|nr:hypothetical protein [Planctomycetaceae bacterium]